MLCSPTLKGIIAGLLPSLALRIFMILLVPILTALTKAEGPVAQSAITDGVTRKHFLFQVTHSGAKHPAIELALTLSIVVPQVFNVYLTTAVVSLFAAGAKSAVETATDPVKIAELLGGTLPGVAIFFTNYVMLQTLIGLPLGASLTLTHTCTHSHRMVLLVYVTSLQSCCDSCHSSWELSSASSWPRQHTIVQLPRLLEQYPMNRLCHRRCWCTLSWLCTFATPRSTPRRPNAT